MNTAKFELQKQITDQMYILYFKGELDLSQADAVRSSINPLVADASRKLVINLRDLTYIDSTGIGVILSILKARDVLKSSLIVEAVPNKIQRLFDITGLTPFLSISK
jgi:anti-anti-sigma factor